VPGNRFIGSAPLKKLFKDGGLLMVNFIEIHTDADSLFGIPAVNTKSISSIILDMEILVAKSTACHDLNSIGKAYP